MPPTSRWSISVKDNKAYVLADGKPLSRRKPFSNILTAKDSKHKGNDAIEVRNLIFNCVAS